MKEHNSKPGGPWNSKLDPGKELIFKMSREEQSCEKIAKALALKCDIKTCRTNVHNYIKVRTPQYKRTLKRKRRYILSSPTDSVTSTTAPVSTPQSPQQASSANDIANIVAWEKIDAFKAKPVSIATAPPTFDETKPLRIIKKE